MLYHKVKVNIYELELWETTEQGLKTKQSPNGEVVLALLFIYKKGRIEPEVPKAICGIPLVVHFLFQQSKLWFFPSEMQQYPSIFFQFCVELAPF